MKICDAHCDTVTKMYAEKAPFSENRLHIDFERMKKYDGYTQVFAVFTPPGSGASAKEYTKNCIGLFYDEMKKNGIAICRSYSELREKNGKYSAFLSLEGAEGISELSDLPEYKRLGVFMIAPTWNFRNRLACGAMEEKDTGLTPFGKRVITEMSRLNIILDVSHMSERSFWEAAEIFKKPLCASHSNSKSVKDHRRNLTDEQFSAIVRSGGAVGLNYYREFSDGSLVPHIDRFLSLGGENSIMLGSDFDGGYPFSDGIKDITGVEAFVKSLPYSTEIREKIAFGNFLRLIKAYDC